MAAMVLLEICSNLAWIDLTCYLVLQGRLASCKGGLRYHRQ